MQTQDYFKPETVEAAVKAGQETFEKAAKAGKDAVGKVYRAGADAAVKGYEQGVTLTRGQVEKVFPKAVDNFDAVAKFNKDTVDAVLASGAIATKGFETVGEELAAAGKKAFEDGVATAKALTGVKTYQDLVELQTAFARQSFDQFVAGTTKISELSAKVATEAAGPLQARWTDAAETFGKTAKAAKA